MIENVFGCFSKNGLNGGRYVPGGVSGNHGVHGAIDARNADGAVGVSALDTARAEVGFEPHLEYITDTKEFNVRTLDLTDGDVQGRLGVTEGQITLSKDVPNAYEKTQQIGDIAKNLGYEAIIYPSAEKQGGKSIVIMRESLF